MTTRAELQRQANDLKRRGAIKRRYAARCRDEMSDREKAARYYDTAASRSFAIAAELEARIEAGEYEGEK